MEGICITILLSLKVNLLWIQWFFGLMVDQGVLALMDSYMSMVIFSYLIVLLFLIQISIIKKVGVTHVVDACAHQPFGSEFEPSLVHMEKHMLEVVNPLNGFQLPREISTGTYVEG